MLGSFNKDSSFNKVLTGSLQRSESALRCPQHRNYDSPTAPLFRNAGCGSAYGPVHIVAVAEDTLGFNRHSKRSPGRLKKSGRAEGQRREMRLQREKVADLQEVGATWQKIAQREEEPREPRQPPGMARLGSARRQHDQIHLKKKEVKVCEYIGEAFDCQLCSFPREHWRNETSLPAAGQLKTKKLVFV